MTEQTNLVPKRRFKEFENTSAWKQSMLGDVIEGLYNGQTPSRFRSDFWNGDINWLTSGELNRSIVKTTIEKITMAGQTDANLRIVPKNTFVLAITGLEAAGTRGNCGILGIDTTLNQSCMALYPNKELLSTHFLFQWYKLVGEDYGLRYTQGTKQQSYNAEIIKNLEICLPQVKEQKKIGRFFKHLDHLIILQQRKLEKTKALKAAYLSEMFPAEGAHVPERRFKEFEGTWKQRKLNEISVVNTGYPFDSKNFNKLGKYLVITNGNIQNGSTFVDDSLGNRIDIQNETLLAKYILHPDEILVTMDGNVGRSAKVINNNQILAQRVCRLIAKEDKEFLYQLLNTGRFSQSMKKASHGGTIKHISLNEIGEYTFLAPPSIEEQEKIGIFLKNIDKIIFLCMYKLEKLQHLKKAYLHEMFV